MCLVQLFFELRGQHYVLCIMSYNIFKNVFAGHTFREILCWKCWFSVPRRHTSEYKALLK